MPDQEEGTPRTLSAGPHDSEPSQGNDLENKTLVDWGSCESLTSDGYLRGNENEA